MPSRTAEQAGPDRIQFCPRCYAAVPAGADACTSCDGLQHPVLGAGVGELSNRLADTLGVERIEGFSAAASFSDLFRRRTPEEVEAHFAWGFPGHVPDPASISAEWPRPWSFLRVLAAGLAAFFACDVGMEVFDNANVVPGLMFTGSFAMPVAMVVFFFEMNTPRNVSFYHLVRLFLLGGVAALVLALLLYAVVPLGSVIGVAAAGPVEEVAKLAIVAFALHRMRLGPRPLLLNSMLVGATVGAGFAAFESAGYAFRALTGELGATTMTDVIVERGVLSPFGHIAWSAIAAAALWRVSRDGPPSMARLAEPRFLQLFGLAVALHAVWDIQLPLPDPAKYAVLAAVAVVAVLSLLQTGIRQAAEPVTSTAQLGASA